MSESKGLPKGWVKAGLKTSLPSLMALHLSLSHWKTSGLPIINESKT